MARGENRPMVERRVSVGGPYFEDLKVGQVFDDAPAVTLTEGHAALHQAIFGDRLRLPLDHRLAAATTGRAEPLAHPNLVCNVAIGQTTTPSQRVRGNLFYRQLVLLRPVHLGDTLRTRTEVTGLRQSSRRPGRPATGAAVLRMRVENQDGKPVLDCWRAPLLPMADPELDTGHADALDDVPADLDPSALDRAVPGAWDLAAFRAGAGPGAHFADIEPGVVYEIAGRDSVTSAPELVRATLNMANTHTDPAAGAHGRRLVYGGHTIGMASALATRALPNLVTILAWRSCDHIGPVFEGDVLRCELTVEAAEPRPAGGGLVDLRAAVWADRQGGGAQEDEVLDWRFVALMA